MSDTTETFDTLRGLRRALDAAHDEIDSLKRDLDIQTAAAFSNQSEAQRLRAAIQSVLDAHDDGREGVCCGQAFPCETVQYLRGVAA